MKKRLINFKFILTIALIEVLCYMAVDMYLASMPNIASYFGTSYSKVQLTLTFYLFSMGIGQLFFGPIIDYFGRKIPLILGVLLYSLCSILITLSTNIELFLLFRIIQGLSVALIYVSIISMVRDVSKGRVAANIFAILITIGAITPILAPTFGGYIEQEFGWKTVFYTLFSLAILLSIMSFFTLQETLKEEKKVKINFKNIFIIYFKIIKDRKFLTPAITACLMYMFVFAYIAGASFAYQEIYKLDSKTFGLIFGLTGSALLFGALLSTKLLKVFNMKQLSISGAFVLVIGSIISFFSVNINFIGFDGIVAGFFISFFGLGLCEASLFSMAMSSQEKSVGATAALLGSLQLLLPASATLVAGYLVEISIIYWLGIILFLGILSFLFTYIVFNNKKL
ncbi:multidrug effflux MFS transporter [Aliarcobacter butzleri]|uniref:Multidrug effflux MFS transporter n=1 Tax=Aliarcobacter butzleri TaxID=28197 RepID=A0AAW7QEG7_9BACT|nr:multidrug effflux MFS transporter [Aliarcobacter butzleri]MBF7070718.1 Bcr/CflA family efflux MFS transporter [Aliarcobacter butzleri]MCG3672530.1 multidrug effflux MFS transporter [Aliarcobacter butzleri]MCG3681474.1 multidrug effflux MFS transporter [Aliarcobacter butzleri]MCG3690772.1 multidrug effflux MFS transporter [Aliarcobacter butzleri]MDH1976433.1 multidrug effflux MFS transporter [Aliarcobacter butzleri]